MQIYNFFTRLKNNLTHHFTISYIFLVNIGLRTLRGSSQAIKWGTEDFNILQSSYSNKSVKSLLFFLEKYICFIHGLPASFYALDCLFPPFSAGISRSLFAIEKRNDILRKPMKPIKFQGDKFKRASMRLHPSSSCYYVL